MTKKVSLSLAASLFLLFFPLVTSCGKEPGNDPGEETPYKQISLSTKQSGFVESGNTFALRFLDAVAHNGSGSFIISPLSAQFVLGMLLDGAEGQTADEIASVLGYGKGEEKQVDAFCRLLLDELPSLDKSTKLSIANGIFVNETVPLKKEYIDRVSASYDAAIENLDFSSPASLQRINSWCSEKTEGLIKDPLKSDQFGPDYLAYIINALYFKGMWKSPFSSSSTGEESFFSEANPQKKVSMMKQRSTFSYSSSDIYETVSLPYGNGNFSMVVMLPRKGYTTSDVAKALLDKSAVDKLGSGGTCEVDLWLPKFETKYHINLNDLLISLGMPSAFNADMADFTALSDTESHLDFVQQDAIIKVDENGSEAAAVTIAGLAKNTSIGPSKIVVFHADHSFLYLIRENSTGAILFAGKYDG